MSDRFKVNLEQYDGSRKGPPSIFWVGRTTGNVYQLYRIYGLPTDSWAAFCMGGDSYFGFANECANGFQPTWQEAVCGLSPLGSAFRLTIEGPDWKEEE